MPSKQLVWSLTMPCIWTQFNVRSGYLALWKSRKRDRGRSSWNHSRQQFRIDEMMSMLPQIVPLTVASHLARSCSKGKFHQALASRRNQKKAASVGLHWTCGILCPARPIVLSLWPFSRFCACTGKELIPRSRLSLLAFLVKFPSEISDVTINKLQYCYLDNLLHLRLRATIPNAFHVSFHQQFPVIFLEGCLSGDR